MNVEHMIVDPIMLLTDINMHWYFFFIDDKMI